MAKCLLLQALEYHPITTCHVDSLTPIISHQPSSSSSSHPKPWDRQIESQSFVSFSLSLFSSLSRIWTSEASKAVMEGLIPFVYRAIVQYKSGNQGPLTAWFPESPSASYMRLPGDSGRFQASDLQFLTTSSSSPSRGHASNAQVVVSSGLQTPLSRLTTTRRVAAWSIYPSAKPENDAINNTILMFLEESVNSMVFYVVVILFILWISISVWKTKGGRMLLPCHVMYQRNVKV